MKNKKKVTLLGVAFIAAVITLAGVGYAAHTGYTGTANGTASETYDVDYVVIQFQDGAAYTPDTTFYMTWNTANVYNQGQSTITYSWQASDARVHNLSITATDMGVDQYKLNVTAPAAPDGYALYYKLSAETEVNPETVANWEPFVGSALASGGAGEAVTTNAFTVSWALVPTTQSGPAAPVTASVTIGTMTYTITATQGN